MSENPYQPPGGTLVEQAIPHSPNYWLLAVAVLFPALVSVGALEVVPKFMALFEGFGADLPLGTKLMLGTYRWWGVSVLAVIVFWFLRQRVNKSQIAVVIFGVGSAIALFVFGVWACYAPIFELAAQA
jgi:hypothetical protein